MAERNVWTEAALEFGDKLANLEREARHSKAIPLGEERVSAEQMRKRLMENPALRRQMVEQGRTREILDLFKGKK